MVKRGAQDGLPTLVVDPVTDEIAFRHALVEWEYRARCTERAHRMAADRAARRDALLRSVVLGGIIAVVAIAAVADLGRGWVRPVLLVVAALAAGVCVFQALLSQSGRAVQHHLAASRFAALRDGIEDAGDADASDARERGWHVEEIRRGWEGIAGSSPALDPALTARAERRTPRQPPPREGETPIETESVEPMTHTTTGSVG
ncbi:MAG: hypothetical protein AB7V42_11745 [Thermoleophilia bacterium]